MPYRRDYISRIIFLKIVVVLGSMDNYACFDDEIVIFLYFVFKVFIVILILKQSR